MGHPRQAPCISSSNPSPQSAQKRAGSHTCKSDLTPQLPQTPVLLEQCSGPQNRSLWPRLPWSPPRTGRGQGAALRSSKRWSEAGTRLQNGAKRRGGPEPRTPCAGRSLRDFGFPPKRPQRHRAQDKRSLKISPVRKCAYLENTPGSRQPRTFIHTFGVQG